jgi:N-acetylglucosamine malate deacetylase 1
MDFTPLLKTLTEFIPSSPLIAKTRIPFTVMIVSPHPDDECIVSGLALRLQHENNAHVINVAATLGSKKDRQVARTKELEAACAHLDFENVILTKKELKALIQKYAPDLIIAPHAKDHHPTHIATSELVKKSIPKKGKVLVAWSEFWGQLSKPNLLVEVPVEILKLQMEALALHHGEVERNPYHLRLPAWMMDNVRRGSEVIGGKGSEAPRFAFGTLYQLQLFRDGKASTPKVQTVLSASIDIGQIFKLILDAAAGSKTRVKRG